MQFICVYFGALRLEKKAKSACAEYLNRLVYINILIGLVSFLAYYGLFERFLENHCAFENIHNFY